MPKNVQNCIEKLKIQRDSDVPLWGQIQKLLAGCIQCGEIKPGEQLPTEHSLAKHFGVNRHTVRRALGHLENLGMLQVERGRGTFVHENIVDYQVSRRTRFSENLKRQNKEPSGTILDTGVKPAPGFVAKALGLSPDAPVVWMRTVSYADDRAISFSDHYYPFSRFEGFLDVYKQRRSVTATFAYFGVFDYTRKNTRITARMPTSEETEHLKLQRNRPVLVTEAVNIDSEGDAIEYARSAFHGEAVQLVVAPDEEDGDGWG